MQSVSFAANSQTGSLPDWSKWSSIVAMKSRVRSG